jgi:hypothetical protein
LPFFDFLPIQKTAILFFYFSTTYLICYLSHFFKIPKRIKKNFGKKEKGKLRFTLLLSSGGISI